MIYIITFLLSLLCIKFSMSIREKNKMISRIFEIIGILLPCILAALRDYSIGTDIRVYVNSLFQNAKSFSSFISYYRANIVVVDFLYLLITYVCSKLCTDIGLLFFVLELLVIVPIYLALKRKFGNSNSLLMGMLLFFLFFYNQSYNMIRQGIAISFVILGLSYLDNDQKKHFFICLLISYMFHSSAIIVFVLYLLYSFVKTNKLNKKVKFIIEVLIVLVCLVAIPFVPKIISLMGDLGIIRPEKEILYMNHIRSTYKFNYYYTFTYIFVLFIMCLLNKEIRNNEKNSSYYFFSAILSIILLQFDSVVSNIGRIVYYMFYPLVIMIVPYVIYNKKITKNSLITLTMVIGFFVAYWVLTIVVANFNETYPYIFR